MSNETGFVKLTPAADGYRLEVNQLTSTDLIKVLLNATANKLVAYSKSKQAALALVNILKQSVEENWDETHPIDQEPETDQTPIDKDMLAAIIKLVEGSIHDFNQQQK